MALEWIRVEIIRVGKNDLKKWRFESKPVFGHEIAGNRRN